VAVGHIQLLAELALGAALRPALISFSTSLLLAGMNISLQTPRGSAILIMWVIQII